MKTRDKLKHPESLEDLAWNLRVLGLKSKLNQAEIDRIRRRISYTRRMHGVPQRLATATVEGLVKDGLILQLMQIIAEYQDAVESIEDPGPALSKVKKKFNADNPKIETGLS